MLEEFTCVGCLDHTHGCRVFLSSLFSVFNAVFFISFFRIFFCYFSLFVFLTALVRKIERLFYKQGLKNTYRHENLSRRCGPRPNSQSRHIFSWTAVVIYFVGVVAVVLFLGWRFSVIALRTYCPANSSLCVHDSLWLRGSHFSGKLIPKNSARKAHPHRVPFQPCLYYGITWISFFNFNFLPFGWLTLLKILPGSAFHSNSSTILRLWKLKLKNDIHVIP